jgi:hypothetical protein
MPSPHHEAVCQLLKRNPLLAPYLVSNAGYRELSGRAELTDSNLSDVEREKRADVVQVIKTPMGHKIALISEVQNSRPKPTKRRSWFCYLANAANDHNCDAILIVIAPTERIARACAKPYSIGHPGLVLKVIVIGPRNTPHPDSPGAEAVTVELTVLNVLNGNFDLTDPRDRRYVLGKLAGADSARRHLYARYLYLSVPRAVRRQLEEDMNHTYRVPFLDEPFEKAEQAVLRAEQETIRAEEQSRKAEEHSRMAEEQARKAEEQSRRAEREAQRAEQITHRAGGMLLRELAARGFEVPETLREMIKACGDIDRIDHWSERAQTAATLEDVFDLAMR